jgi:hypothetical protein
MLEAGVEALSWMFTTGALAVMSVPVLLGSRTDFTVVAPVLLVESAVDFHTAAREVKSAVPLDPLGVGGLGAGHDS